MGVEAVASIDEERRRGAPVGGSGSGLWGLTKGRLAASGNVLAVVSRIPRATISIRVQPRARSDALATLRGGVLIVRVMAPPLDGRANDSVCRLLARALGVRASDVTIIRGERTRDKVVAIDGVDQAAADAAVRVAVNR